MLGVLLRAAHAEAIPSVATFRTRNRSDAAASTVDPRSTRIQVGSDADRLGRGSARTRIGSDAVRHTYSSTRIPSLVSARMKRRSARLWSRLALALPLAAGSNWPSLLAGGAQVQEQELRCRFWRRALRTRCALQCSEWVPTASHDVPERDRVGWKLRAPKCSLCARSNPHSTCCRGALRGN